MQWGKDTWDSVMLNNQTKRKWTKTKIKMTLKENRCKRGKLARWVITCWAFIFYIRRLCLKDFPSGRRLHSLEYFNLCNPSLSNSKGYELSQLNATYLLFWLIAGRLIDQRILIQLYFLKVFSGFSIQNISFLLVEHNRQTKLPSTPRTSKR